MQQDRENSPVAVLVEEPGASRSAVEWEARKAGRLGNHPDDGWIATGFDDALAASDADVADDDDQAEQVEYQRPLSYACQGTWV